MATEVVTSYERARGCGYRRPSKGGVGIYLVGPSTGAPCGRLPFELLPCPTCGGGVHPARGWQWIEPRVLFGGSSLDDRINAVEACGKEFEKKTRLPMSPTICSGCPMGGGMPENRHGLIWVGGGHYTTPGDFLREARDMGISRKIKAVPKGFRLGETIVYLAHRKAVLKETIPAVPENADGKGRPEEQRFAPGVFSVFRPTGIDLVIDDPENVPERAQKLAEQHGARIVKVVPVESPGAFGDDEEDASS